MRPYPFNLARADLWAVGDLVDVIQARREAAGRQAAAFVVSRQVVGSNLAGAAADALAAYDLPVLNGRTSQRVAFAETMIAGETVYESPDRKAAEEVYAIKHELLRLIHEQKA